MAMAACSPLPERPFALGLMIYPVANVWFPPCLAGRRGYFASSFIIRWL